MSDARFLGGWLLVGAPLAFALACGAPSPPAGPPRLTNSLGMQFVRVPAGSFRMGAADQDQPEFCRPQHTVTISRPFYLGIHEVTQRQYEQVMRVNPSRFGPHGQEAQLVAARDTGDLPVDRVTWEEAVEFCRRLSQRPEEQAAGRSYRLPTEAEWEYACRAGTATAFSCGDTLDRAIAVFGQPDPGAGGGPRPVGSLAANAFGLYDMHGNVWEWCGDGPRQYTPAARVDPRGPTTLFAVLRGGAWDYPAEYCRSDARFRALGGYVYFGFRVLCEVGPTAVERGNPTALETGADGSAAD